MSIRPLIAAAVVAAGTLVPATGALAAPPHPVPAAPAHRPANYTLTGVVGAAGAGSVSVVVSGGNARAPKSSTTVLAVPAEAVVVVDGVVADLGAVLPGQRVLVKGTQVGGVVTVARVEASTAG